MRRRAQPKTRNPQRYERAQVAANGATNLQGIFAAGRQHPYWTGKTDALRIKPDPNIF